MKKVYVCAIPLVVAVGHSLWFAYQFIWTGHGITQDQGGTLFFMLALGFMLAIPAFIAASVE